MSRALRSAVPRPAPTETQQMILYAQLPFWPRPACGPRRAATPGTLTGTQSTSRRLVGTVMKWNASSESRPPRARGFRCAALRAPHRCCSSWEQCDTGRSTRAFDTDPYPVSQLADDAITILNAVAGARPSRPATERHDIRRFGIGAPGWQPVRMMTVPRHYQHLVHAGQFLCTPRILKTITGAACQRWYRGREARRYSRNIRGQNDERAGETCARRCRGTYEKVMTCPRPQRSSDPGG